MITNWCHGHKTILINLQKICDKFIKMIQKKSKNHDDDEWGKFFSIELLLIKDVANFGFKHKKILPKPFELIFNRYMS